MTAASATWEGFIYVTFVIDAFAQRIVRAGLSARSRSGWLGRDPTKLNRKGA